jgi:mitogen-activated protein kinase 1/3
MLKLNPNQRITAAEAIKDPYFDDIRLEEQEESSEPEIKLEFDEAGKENMTVEELKKLIIAEINEISHFNFNFDGDFEEELCEDY